MRIIAGKHRGRRINSLPTKELRPTMGVTREAIFNILSHGQFLDLLPGARVLDLYCGCGAFAMEAFSRGAAHVVCIDIRSEHLQVARSNIDYIGESHNANFIRADSSNPPAASIPCNLIFLDPPYYKNLVTPTLVKLLSSGWLAANAVIVIETGAKEEFTIPEQYEDIENRKYGNSRIHILKKS
jgi:16S rRNA (guanine966-N2)-methyltransferase